MPFRVKETLTDTDIEKGLRAMMNDGLATQAMVILTGGAFLVAFALKLGASSTVTGILATTPPLLQLLQIPAVYLVEKVRNRRAITVYASILSRIFFLLIALIPFLFGYKAGLTFLAVFLVFNSAFSAVSAASWNSWVRDIVPEKTMGSYFSSRMRAATALGIFLSLAGAFYIDFWKTNFVEFEIYGYSILFFLGFVAGMIGVFFLAISPEPRMKISEESDSFLKRIIKPFKDLNFRNLLFFSGAWSFAVSLAAPFFTVYMLKRLELNMSFVIGLSVLSQIMNFLFFRVWGRFSDRIGNKAVLGLNCPLFIFSILGWTFTTLPGKYFLTIPHFSNHPYYYGDFSGGSQSLFRKSRFQTCSQGRSHSLSCREEYCLFYRSRSRTSFRRNVCRFFRGKGTFMDIALERSGRRICSSDFESAAMGFLLYVFLYNRSLFHT